MLTNSDNKLNIHCFLLNIHCFLLPNSFINGDQNMSSERKEGYRMIKGEQHRNGSSKITSKASSSNRLR